MGKEPSPYKYPEYLTHYEMPRVTKWLLRIGNVLAFAAFAYFIYGMEASIAESDAVIEACKHNQTFECMGKARAEYRKNH